MASFLSPIVSGGSSSASDGRDYDTAATIEGAECRRLIAGDRNQCRTPSTSSQVSELDDEINTSQDQQQTHGTAKSNVNNNTNGNNKASGGGLLARAASLSSTASGGSIAQQFLLHHEHRSSSVSSTSENNNRPSQLGHRHTSNYLYNNLKQTKKFKQILQSIPLPLVATSIMIVFIMCLLLSECKSFQLSQGGSVQSLIEPQVSPFVDKQQQPQQYIHRVDLARILGSKDTASGEDSTLDGGGSFRSIKLLRRHQQQPRSLEGVASGEAAELEAAASQQPGGGAEGDPLEPANNFAAKLGEFSAGETIKAGRDLDQSQAPPRQQQQQQLDFGQLELRRQNLRGPAQRHKQPQFRGQTNKRHSADEQQESNLSSMLLFGLGGSVDAAGQQEANGGAQQGEPAEPAADAARASSSEGETLQVTGNEELEQVPRPANLRSSTLELGSQMEADRQPSQLQAAALVSEQTNHRHRYSNQQHPSHLQQQQHNYKLTNSNEEQHVKNHHHHHQQQQHFLGSNGNNHDRPFDVYQIQCNNTEEGFERYACPTADNLGRFRCIEDSLFCDGYYDCPGGEDENRVSCMYYKLLKSP